MNRINPLYLGLLLVALILFISFKLSGAKNDLMDVKESYQDSAKLSIELSELKKTYTNRLKLPSSISRSITQKVDKSGVVISSQSMDSVILNALMSRVLNSSYNIKELKIKKLSDTKVSLYMEIRW
ncbi:MAG: hypothetical protein U9N33_04695 [Campylobacterota bacterium]|nr:hypothetical protein [Campylobacterota bacterium]